MKGIFNNIVYRFERIVEFSDVFRTALGHVGFTATFSTCDFGDVLDDLSCVIFVHQVFCNHADDCSLAVRYRCENNNAKRWNSTFGNRYWSWGK